MNPPVITLLTDFGLRDPYVGQVKGVLLSRCPSVRVIDLTHEVPPQAVSVGVFFLQTSWRFFPAGSVHLAVVDPGVGTEREVVALRREGHLFLGPDNGMLAGVASEGRIFRLRTEREDLPDRSDTFHGRDLFAPLAADLANGRPLEEMGVACGRKDLVPCPLPEPERRDDGGLVGEVLLVDHFGNLITNLLATDLPERVELTLANRSLPLVRTYGGGQPGQPCALVNSFGVLEVAVPLGSAAEVLKVERGETVTAAAK